MLLLLLASAPVAAADVQRLFAIAGLADPVGAIQVDLTLLNSGPVPVTVEIEPQEHASLDIDGIAVDVILTRSAAQNKVTIPPSGFVKIRYSFHPAANHRAAGAPPTQMAVLTVPGWAADGIAFRFDRTAERSVAESDSSTTPTPPAGQRSVLPAPVAASADHGNAFLANLSAYEPIYAVFGSGTDTDGRLQVSFKFQLFGRSLAEGGDHKWIDGIHFGYTQRMYWDLGGQSSPFRNIDFMPELFYLVPARQLTDRLALGGQAGFRHESNGRDGPASRSLNTVYIQPVATLQVGGDWTLTLGPRVWLYAGSLSDNPDINRYRGHTGLIAEIGQANGLRIRTSSRINFGTGKGAIDADVSYPLNRIIAHNLNLYLFGQAFAGYGENLFDYDRRVTRLRFGIGIVR
ncbi:phospholipase A [Sphingomonas oryzagri]